MSAPILPPPQPVRASGPAQPQQAAAPGPSMRLPAASIRARGKRARSPGTTVRQPLSAEERTAKRCRRMFDAIQLNAAETAALEQIKTLTPLYERWYAGLFSAYSYEVALIIEELQNYRLNMHNGFDQLLGPPTPALQMDAWYGGALMREAERGLAFFIPFSDLCKQFPKACGKYSLTASRGMAEQGAAAPAAAAGQTAAASAPSVMGGSSSGSGSGINYFAALCSGNALGMSGNRPSAGGGSSASSSAQPSSMLGPAASPSPSPSPAPMARPASAFGSYSAYASQPQSALASKAGGHSLSGRPPQAAAASSSSSSAAAASFSSSARPLSVVGSSATSSSLGLGAAAAADASTVVKRQGNFTSSIDASKMAVRQLQPTKPAPAAAQPAAAGRAMASGTPSVAMQHYLSSVLRALTAFESFVDPRVLDDFRTARPNPSAPQCEPMGLQRWREKITAQQYHTMADLRTDRTSIFRRFDDDAAAGSSMIRQRMSDALDLLLYKCITQQRAQTAKMEAEVEQAKQLVKNIEEEYLVDQRARASAAPVASLASSSAAASFAGAAAAAAATRGSAVRAPPIPIAPAVQPSMPMRLPPSSISARASCERGRSTGLAVQAAQPSSVSTGKRVRSTASVQQRISAEERDEKRRRRMIDAIQLNAAETAALEQLKTLGAQHDRWWETVSTTYSGKLADIIFDLHAHLDNVHNGFGDLDDPPTEELREDARRGGALMREAQRGIEMLIPLEAIGHQFPRARSKFCLMMNSN